MILVGVLYPIVNCVQKILMVHYNVQNANHHIFHRLTQMLIFNVNYVHKVNILHTVLQEINVKLVKVNVLPVIMKQPANLVKVHIMVDLSHIILCNVSTFVVTNPSLISHVIYGKVMLVTDVHHHVK